MKIIVLFALLLILTGCGGEPEPPEPRPIPILMFHALTEHVTDPLMQVTPAQFRDFMTTMQDEGFTPITFGELEEYVNGTGTLPTNPFIITFDDGYLCNYEYAFPILQELNIPATINIVAGRRGATTYRGLPSTPHFTWANAETMANSGLITLGNHTYNMHGMFPYAGNDWATYGANPDFAVIFANDLQNFHNHMDTNIFAYPFGIYNPIASELLRSAGYTITLLTGERVSFVTRGDPQTLKNLYRINVSGNFDGSELVQLIRTLSK
ncbi:MAG: polysaccharide deacetylase family protein [Defluviitaleaceae bacterium]|nr:polysaccharide deacetylase family protein [Defluviitaleaceae bacterium]